MSENTIVLDEEKERKTNKNLAIGVGVLGFGAFGAFYVLFFIIMILKPGLILSMMPIQSITKEVVTDGNRTYLLSSKPDMSTVSFDKKQKPEVKHFIAVLEGKIVSAPQEIPAYVSASGSDNRLVLFSNGRYRSYDGSKWVEAPTSGIGKDPTGITTPLGLFVISSFEEKIRLNHISDDVVTVIPLPDEFLRSQSSHSCPCIKLVWYQGQLCLFWSAENSIAWTSWNGSTWSPAATSAFSGSFQVMPDRQRLYFFHQEGNGPERALSYYTLENNEWTGPARLLLPAPFFDWHAFIQRGLPMLLVKQPFSQTVYTIEKDALVDPVCLNKAFNIPRIMRTLALITVCSNILIFLTIFGFSSLIRKYKNRYWTQSGTQYEFASLTRRFVAYIIDDVIILVPSVFVIALFMIPVDLSLNPLRVVAAILFAIIFFFLGGFVYHALCEGLFGATLGKKICGIRVLKADFTKCDLSAGFLRNLLRIVDCFFYYLVATIALAGTRKWQRLGDLAAETVVVQNNISSKGEPNE